VAIRRTGGAPARLPHATSSDLDDGSLLVRARTDPEAFAAFYDRLHAPVLRYFLFQTGSHHLAAELTAETFAQALASLGHYDPERGTGSAWLYGIANHQFHRFLRRGEVDHRHRRRLRVVTPTATADEVERAIDVADAHLLLPQLTSALALLSDPIRSAVLLRIGADLPYAEVAARLGCSEGTARIRVSRGLRQLVATMAVP
jgi:RNA polymerase sigma-70 factor (ECF subfamily)